MLCLKRSYAALKRPDRLAQLLYLFTGRRSRNLGVTRGRLQQKGKQKQAKIPAGPQKRAQMVSKKHNDLS
jgi:hypothetical protein